MEALPRRHATLVLLEGVVPGLCRAAEVVRGEPGTLQGEGALFAKELLALVESVEGVLRVVISGEVQFGKPRRCLSRSVVANWLRGAQQRGLGHLVSMAPTREVPRRAGGIAELQSGRWRFSSRRVNGWRR